MTALFLSTSVLADEPAVCGDASASSWLKPTVKRTVLKPNLKRPVRVAQKPNVYPARVAATEGQVYLLARDGRDVRPATALVAGDAVHLSDVIQTGVQSFVNIRLGDGTQMVLPSNTHFQLTQVNQRLARVKLISGQVENYVPKHNKTRKNIYEIQTPAVVLGVRGTHFRVNYDASTQITTASVLEGAVALNSLRQCVAPLMLNHGEGVRMKDVIPAQASILLSAPVLTESARDAQVDSEVRFRLQPVDGAVRYHAELSRDAKFLNKVKEVYNASPDLNFGHLPSGFYYVRVTAIDANGIEGRFSDSFFLRNFNSGAAPYGLN